jgi:hypothetical protein
MGPRTHSPGSGGQPRQRFGMAVLVLLLPCLLRYGHTCHLFETDRPGPIVSGHPLLDGGPTPHVRDGSGRPCLACMFLDAFSTMRISACLLMLSAILILLHCLPQSAVRFVASDVAPLLQSRAPPWSLAQLRDPGHRFLKVTPARHRLVQAFTFVRIRPVCPNPV